MSVIPTAASVAVPSAWRSLFVFVVPEPRITLTYFDTFTPTERFRAGSPSNAGLSAGVDTRKTPSGQYTVTWTSFYHSASSPAVRSVSSSWPTPVVVRNP